MAKKNGLYVWVWQDVVRDLAEQNNFFNVCQLDSIKKVFCSLYYPWWANESIQVNAFITRAHGLGIDVYGIPEVLAADLATPTNSKAQILALLNYNDANPGAMFDGIHFDVETPGQGEAAIDIYANYFRTVKNFFNTAGSSLISQGMRFSAYLDPPHWMSGVPYGNAAGVAAATELYQEFDEIDLVGYEVNKTDLLMHLADGPAICTSLGVVFRCGFELSQEGYWGEIGPLGLNYYWQFAAEMDAYFASYTYYGGRYVEQYSSLKTLLEGYMAAYIFQPSQAKTAKLPLNLDPSLVGLALTAELFLSKDGGTTKASTSGKIPFTAATTQNITMPITMPAAAGAYKAYIDILYGNAFFLGFVDVNDILIPGGSVGPIVWT